MFVIVIINKCLLLKHYQTKGGLGSELRRRF
jgi:hypothetical protein